MPALSLRYAYNILRQPFYLTHADVEEVAAQARAQLTDSDAITLSVLKTVDSLDINGLKFDLWVDTEHVVHDEQDNVVLGVCEFDPAASTEAASLSVSPAGEWASEQLVLSTFCHELGHAVFDAPSWIADTPEAPGLFDDKAKAFKAYRSTTNNSEHLQRRSSVESTVHFAELRANEFMGSLLVPRKRLLHAIESLAPAHHGLKIHRTATLDPSLVGDIVAISTSLGGFGSTIIEAFQGALAQRFGVNRKFIQVRMERYGIQTK